VRPGGLVILEILTGVAALFVFVYLLWALLRPEDF
jgi:K+-transporting ATPase KdpF subunit